MPDIRYTNDREAQERKRMNQTQTIQTGTMDRSKRSKTIQSFAELFWSKVVTSASGCWTWTASVGKNGYGRFRNGKTSYDAHRLAYQLAHGPIPDGLKVLHSCDNRRCVAPYHLRAGSTGDNVRDTVARHPKFATIESRRAAFGKPGESNGNHKLTEVDVFFLKFALGLGATVREVAAAFGISDTQVYKIRKGEAWTHL